MLQHVYYRCILQQASREKRLRHRFRWRGSSDEEHIITTGWWCKPAVMMDYHRRLVRRSGGDSYQPRRSYEPVMILSALMVSITNVLMIAAVIEALVICQSVVVQKPNLRA